MEQTVSKPKIIVSFLGLPASGKGTQAKLLSSRIDTDKVVGIGVLMREIIEMEDSKDPFVLEIKKRYFEGIPQPDLVAIDLVKKYLDQDHDRHIILDNFPFSIQQMNFLKEYIASSSNEWRGPIIIHLKSDPETIVRRAIFRKVCPSCETIYGDTDEVICEKCGSSLIIRPDDNEETLRKRISYYIPRIREIVEEAQRQNLSVVEIDGMQTINNVAKELWQNVDKYFK